MASLTHHWIRKLTESRKPAYLLIPELIEEDLASGRLRPRDRLNLRGHKRNQTD